MCSDSASAMVKQNCMFLLELNVSLDATQTSQVDRFVYLSSRIVHCSTNGRLTCFLVTRRRFLTRCSKSLSTNRSFSAPLLHRICRIRARSASYLLLAHRLWAHHQPCHHRLALAQQCLLRCRLRQHCRIFLCSRQRQARAEKDITKRRKSYFRQRYASVWHIGAASGHDVCPVDNRCDRVALAARHTKIVRMQSSALCTCATHLELAFTVVICE